MTKISFIVVAYNAAQSLDALLGDLLAQTVDPRQLEALLVDSASTDDTAQIMRRFAEHAPFEVKLLENPKRWLACGINVALRAATGDAIIRLDAHARMPKDFLQKNLDALARGKDIVGGSVIGADPDNAWEAVTRALDTSRFCGGAAPFRNGGEARYVDTLAYALYRREVYDRVGFYDERLRRTEDNDMHYRMRKAGYRFYFSPDIVSWHAARKTLRGQLSQKWGNGYWIGRTMRIQPRCFAPRHLVPALFVLALIALLLLLPLCRWPLLTMLTLYGALDLFFAAKSALEAPRGKLLTFICLPFLFPVVHIVYGAGTLCGPMLEWIDDITRFIFLSDKPQKADILFIPGNGHAEPSEYAAELYHQGYAPLFLPSGRFSVTTGTFSGQQSGARTYEGRFETEWAFMRAVLMANGVPENAILREDEATFTYQNAIYSRRRTDAEKLTVRRALLCCMPIHARRAKMYYQTLFPETELLICPAPGASITCENWMHEPDGIDAVLGELTRCGSQFHDILREITL